MALVRVLKALNDHCRRRTSVLFAIVRSAGAEAQKGVHTSFTAGCPAPAFAKATAGRPALQNPNALRGALLRLQRCS